MEYEKIRELINDMGNSKLTAIDIDFPDGTKISMKKEAKQETVVVNQDIKAPIVETVIENRETVQQVKGKVVKSPMVGTFYMKPSPTANPYVEVGKNVKIGDTLCIIEAMKLMNEIESEYAGNIAKVLVEDGMPVEYGTELFIIE